MDRRPGEASLDDLEADMRRPVARPDRLGLLPRREAPAQLAAYGEWDPSAELGGVPEWTLPELVRRGRLAGVVLLGTLAAASVGYLTAKNPSAAPPHVAVIFRLVVILSLVLAGAFVVSDFAQKRMGRALLVAGFCSCVWLLNGSTNSLAFSIAVLFTGIMLPLFNFLMLAHPGGRLHSGRERLLIAATALVLVPGWAFCWLTGRQPQISTPLLVCKPHCPQNALFVGSSSATTTVRSLVLAAWVLSACGTFLLLLWRLRVASPPVRRSRTPTLVVSMFAMLFLLGHMTSAGPPARQTFGYLYVGMAAAIPLSILLGLALERQFMGQALARFVDQLAGVTPSRLQQLMAEMLHDPTLTIAYRRPRHGTYVDSAGARVAPPAAVSRRAVADIAPEGAPIASVMYDNALADQEAFVRAAGAAAALRLQEAQLEADLKASMSDLAQSRRRLIEAADAERERIERDLHDGAQQHLVGMRVKLELATEAMKQDRERGERMLAEIGVELEEALEELRSLAHGVYPPLLTERGLAEALKSAARGCPLPVSVHVDGVRRHPADIETAIYFCCREALQNVARHAGREAAATLRLWEEPSRLCFEVRDSGVGFTHRVDAAPGAGIVNMRDRVEAVGGTLSVGSRKGAGTVVTGVVPVSAAVPPSPEAGVSGW
jgi:signal transduction histidine kinase